MSALKSRDSGVFAVILGAGHGRRAGGPKALKVLDGDLLWRQMARRFADVAKMVVVVLHPAARDVSIERQNVTAVHADPDAPMFASLVRGLALVPRGAAALVHPVDAGIPHRSLLHALIREHGELDVQRHVIAPMLRDGPAQGRRGHPVLLSPTLVEELLTLPTQTSRLDHVLAGLPASARINLPWDDAEVLANYNADGIGR